MKEWLYALLTVSTMITFLITPFYVASVVAENHETLAAFWLVYGLTANLFITPVFVLKSTEFLLD